METKVIMRISDMQDAIQDYQFGYYSDKEFMKKIDEIKEKLDNAIIEHHAEESGKKMMMKAGKLFGITEEQVESQIDNQKDLQDEIDAEHREAMEETE